MHITKWEDIRPLATRSRHHSCPCFRAPARSCSVTGGSTCVLAYHCACQTKVFVCSVFSLALCTGSSKQRYHTLKWVMVRKDAFQYLMTDHDAQATGSKELTASEWNLLLSIVDPTRPESVHFWATAQLIHSLSEWGVSVSCWLHQCRCAPPKRMQSHVI